MLPIHWHQPDGKPVPMAERRGVPPEWWEASGFCTRYAPSPGSVPRQQTHWRVTHEDDGCGDGAEVEEPATLTSENGPAPSGRVQAPRLPLQSAWA